MYLYRGQLFVFIEDLQHEIHKLNELLIIETQGPLVFIQSFHLHLILSQQRDLCLYQSQMMST